MPLTLVVEKVKGQPLTPASLIGKAVEANVACITRPSSNARLATALPGVSVTRGVVTAHTVTPTRLTTCATGQVPCTRLNSKIEGEYQ